MTLFNVAGILKGSEERQLALGPWKIPVQVDAVSDLITPKAATYWMTLANMLRLYLIVKEHECWLLVLDPVTLKAIGEKTGFDADTVTMRLSEIRPAIKGQFLWEHDRWVQTKIFPTV